MLVGRATELEAGDELIAHARAGRGGVLVVHGDAGIGKTALLEEARARASGLTVLSATGIEAESELALAALAELLGPLSDRIDELSARQAGALRAALALGPPLDGDRFAVWAGALALLALASAERPLLLALDDAHWLDRPSADCLAYAARRLQGKPIALVATVRAGVRGPFCDAAFPRVDLGPLPPAHARALLGRAAPDLAPVTVEAVLEAADGNPLALQELPAGLTPEQRAGRAALADPLEAGGRLQAAFERTLSGLSTGSRQAMLVAAVSGGLDLRPITAACRSLGVDPRALEESEAAGLVRLSGAEIRFAHPLMRGAVYRAAPAAERRRAHRALAEATDPDSRPWHLAAAAIGPDEEAATALEQLAGRASARGGQVLAADALERAADLSADRGGRARRLLTAGRLAVGAGMHQRAISVLEEAAVAEDAQVVAEARGLLAHASLYGGQAANAARLFGEEAERLEPVDPERAAARHADGALAAMVAGDCRRALASAERGSALLPPGADPATRALSGAALSWCLTLRGRTREAKRRLASVAEDLRSVDPASSAGRSIALAINNRIAFEDFEQLRAECRAAGEAAREAAALGALPFLMLVELDAGYRLGDWDGLDEHALEAVRLAEETGQRGPLTHLLVIRAALAAVRGREGDCRADIEHALAITEPSGLGSVSIMAQGVIGLLELGLGRMEAAIAALEQVARKTEEAGLVHPAVVPWAPDLVDAYVRAGRSDEAVPVLELLEHRASAAGGRWGPAAAARCRGLVEQTAFELHFERALELHAGRSSPWEHARTLLAYGERLHRARRRSEARERLRAARALFERLDARPWAERAGDELRAAGGRRGRARGAADDLTARELQVARLVARGATNRQIASELFLSEKTIEFHLSRVFRKLGVSSRVEVAARMGSKAAEPVRR